MQQGIYIWCNFILILSNKFTLFCAVKKKLVVEMKFINELLNGRVTLLGIVNQVDDDTYEVVKYVVETSDLEYKTKLKHSTTVEDNEEEFEVENNIKYFDVELKLI